jgi:hypothetical protein
MKSGECSDVAIDLEDYSLLKTGNVGLVTLFRFSAEK